MKRALLFAGSALVLFASASACDDLNRPMAVPHSEPRHGCFSDVECPSSMKCMKGPNDVQGVCEPRGVTTTPPTEDGGAPTSDGGTAPLPAPAGASPAPGEVSL